MGLTPNYAWPTPELSDPANVPADMKTLADAVDATVRAIADAIVPIGTLAMWAAATPPDRWLLCQGQTNIAAVDYPVLASVLGQTGGVVKMPDLKGRVPLGVGESTATGHTPHALLGLGGAESVALSTAQLAAHAHTEATAGGHSHAHTLGVNAGGAHAHVPDTTDNAFVVVAPVGGNKRVGNINKSVVETAGVKQPFSLDGGDFGSNFQVEPAPDHTHPLGGAITAVAAHSHTINNAGGGAAHENMAPYLVVNFIIKADR